MRREGKTSRYHSSTDGTADPHIAETLACCLSLLASHRWLDERPWVKTRLAFRIRECQIA